MHIYKYVPAHIILHKHVSITSVTIIIIRVLYNKNISIASKWSQNHIISEKYKMVPSFKQHFLQNSPPYNHTLLPAKVKALETFLEAISALPSHSYCYQ